MENNLTDFAVAFSRKLQGSGAEIGELEQATAGDHPRTRGEVDGNEAAAVHVRHGGEGVEPK